MFGRKWGITPWLVAASLFVGCSSESNDHKNSAEVTDRDPLLRKRPEGTMPADTIKGNIVIPPSDPSDFGYTGEIKDSVLLTLGELIKILPEIPGYKHADTANGESYARRTSGGIQSYVKHQYASGNKIIQVEIVDYNMSADQFKGLLSMYERNTSVQKPEEISKLVTGMPGGPGSKAVYISYPQQNACRFIYGVDDRFLILLSGTQMQDETLLKSTALKIESSLLKAI